MTTPDKEGLNETVELMGRKINAILKGEINLGLDEVVFTRVPPDPA